MDYSKLLEDAKREGIVKNVVGALILNEEGKYLILSRKVDDFMGGIKELPSGNMESGETIEDSIIREVKEETNLDIEKIEKFISSFDYLSSSGKKARQYNFRISVKSIDNIILTEHDSYEWMSIDDVENCIDITDETKNVILKDCN